jgi:hypothetical protein
MFVSVYGVERFVYGKDPRPGGMAWLVLMDSDLGFGLIGLLGGGRAFSLITPYLLDIPHKK